MSTRLRVLATGLGLGLTMAACSSNRVTVGGGPSYRYPHQEAYGRTMTCPDSRLPPLRDGGVSPDAARCSFADAQGSRVVHVGGKVLTEAEDPSEPGIGVADVEVGIHRLAGVSLNLDDPGPKIAHARTDAQGRYSVSGTFPPGNYAAIARQPQDQRFLAYRMFVVAEGAIGRIDGVMITIPLDQRLGP
ncbi:hypothetical protein SAMN02745121_00195 [Nannocystis exedens]|uniref:Carboxypeptidase regulatory-like domain-containing protein n=1 Tax=Nannocystis exedens TaxID=54 RepID=A0A1I1SQ15_9BACT|nr:hypothetical protein [Nannocystis exedens]PCC75655.1 hypothetical protein NAEX_08767 [Nannocystis exedens]SFD48569.1 hypothetical protein SAMN02745121_00195 [Nannocystis exedens]